MFDRAPRKRHIFLFFLRQMLGCSKGCNGDHILPILLMETGFPGDISPGFALRRYCPLLCIFVPVQGARCYWPRCIKLLLLSKCLSCSLKNCQKILRPHFHSKGMGLLSSLKQISLVETKFSVRNLYFLRQMVHISHHLSLYFQNLQRKYAKLLLLETRNESVLRSFTQKKWFWKKIWIACKNL